MSLYYQDDLDRLCECGCGTPVIRRFVSGHNRRGAKTGDAHRARIAESQRKAWETKRVRMPLGSRRKDANGYWLVKVREGGGRWDKEHVLIAEQSIGRATAYEEFERYADELKSEASAEIAWATVEWMESQVRNGQFLVDMLAAQGIRVVGR